jgi:hypothetical protein
MSYVIQPEVDCSSAVEFLEALSPVGAYFQDVKPYDTWLFRGQGADLPLVPSAFRANGNFAKLTRRNIQDYDQRLLAERDMLIDFFEIADKRGLILPDDSQEMRAHLETLRSERGDRLVAENLHGWRTANLVLSLTALAQHYGVPTRLLDWTRRSFIAAFFAAEDAWKRSNSNGTDDNLVVWSFYFPLFGKHDVISRDTDPIWIVTAPSATNKNLQAQQGAFTLLNTLYFKESESPYPALDQLLEERASYVTDPSRFPEEWLVTNCRLRKFSLPATQALNLLYLLAKFDITPSSVYPGYQSIFADLKLRAAWQ